MNAITARNIMLKLNEWRNVGIKCDVILMIGEHKFHAHKHILAAAIEFFDKLFTANFVKKKNNTITLEDVDPYGFRLTLDYIYTQKIKIDDDNFQQVLSVANYYQIECLIEKLLAYLKRIISADNGFYYYRLVDFMGNERMKQFTKEFIQRNFLSCSNGVGFLDVPYPVLLEFIDSPIIDELDRFKIIMNWIQNDLNKRPDYLSHLIEHVRFEHISSDIILDEILEYQLVTNNPEIIKAIKKRRKMEQTVRIYGMNGSDLIRVDILNSKLEATYTVAKLKLNYDEFRIISAAGAIYISTYKYNYGNRLYRFKDSQLVLLTSKYDRLVPNQGIVYYEKHKTIYENNNRTIYSYNLDTKSSVVECHVKSFYEISGPLVCYNDFIYTVSKTTHSFYILQYNLLNKEVCVMSKITGYSTTIQSAVLDDKMFIIGGDLVQMYDITNGECTIIIESINYIRDYFNHSLITDRNRLYAIREHWDVIDVFDPSKKGYIDQIYLEINNKSIFNMKRNNKSIKQRRSR